MQRPRASAVQSLLAWDDLRLSVFGSRVKLCVVSMAGGSGEWGAVGAREAGRAFVASAPAGAMVACGLVF